MHALGDPAVLYRYTTALNGFAATLTSDQVRQARGHAGRRARRAQHQAARRPGAPSVRPRRPSAAARATCSASPDRDGAWARHGGPQRAGRGVVVGVVDTGIWPDNPSFSGLPQRTPGTAPALPGFHGACDAAEEWSRRGLQRQGRLGPLVRQRVRRGERRRRGVPLPPRRHRPRLARRVDGRGRPRRPRRGRRPARSAPPRGWRPRPGSRSTRRAGPPPTRPRTAAPPPTRSPRSTRRSSDGVDVLNYSVSGSRRVDDAVERAFLGAATAGVFVATSAGNDGPAAGTVGHVSPVGDHRRRRAPTTSSRARSGSATAARSSARWSPTSRCGPPVSCSAPTSPRPARPPTPPGSARPAASTPPGRRAASWSATAATAPAWTSPRPSRTPAAPAWCWPTPAAQSTDADVHAVPTVHLDADRVGGRAGLRPAGPARPPRLDPRARTASPGAHRRRVLRRAAPRSRPAATCSSPT